MTSTKVLKIKFKNDFTEFTTLIDSNSGTQKRSKVKFKATTYIMTAHQYIIFLILLCLSPFRMYNPKQPAPPNLSPHPPEVLTGQDEEGGEQRHCNDSSPGHLEVEKQELYWTEWHT